MYHNSVTESTANGGNSKILYILTVIVGIYFIFVSQLKTLEIDGKYEHIMTQLMMSFLSYTYYDSTVDYFPVIYFPVMTMQTLIGSTCFLWNPEFKNFIYRKASTKLSIIFNRPNRRPHVPYFTTHESWSSSVYQQFSKIDICDVHVGRSHIGSASKRVDVELSVPSHILLVKEANHSTSSNIVEYWVSLSSKNKLSAQKIKSFIKKSPSLWM